MRTQISTLSLIAFLAALPAVAQETTEPAPEATPEAAPEATPEATAETAPDAAADATSEAPADPAASTEPQVGQPYIRQEFGDWSLRCIKAEEGQPDPCQLYQLLKDQQGNDVAEVSMFPLTDAGEAVAGATIVTPLETLLTEGLALQVDDGEARAYPFSFCTTAGCVARLGFTQAEIDAFKAGNAATVRIVPAGAPDQEVLLQLSLSGFTAAFSDPSMVAAPAE